MYAVSANDCLQVLPCEAELTGAPAYRISHSFAHEPSLPTISRVVYHTLNPHPALSPVPDAAIPLTVAEQSEHETQYRQILVQSALAILLPTEDLENACLRTLVTDVLAESILGNAIGGKASESYLIWGTIRKIAILVKARLQPKATVAEIEVDTRSRLEKFGLLSERGDATGPKDDSKSSAWSTIFWLVLQYIYLLFIAIQFVIQGLIAASAGRPRVSPQRNMTASSPILKSAQPLRSIRPLLDFKIFSLIAAILDLPLRTPWLSGVISLLQYHLISGPFKFGATNGILDK